ncbi:MAG: DUF1997 domain-containing protein [Leptolyngbyaceae cyanobacterium CSU_1_3]|nr:DUF1997 domain-containing protein [Leptolyngbyaceae cyanobacterium CSU_1_3]
MQSQSTDPNKFHIVSHPFAQADPLNLSPLDPTQTGDAAPSVTEPTQFRSHFVDSMEMSADAKAVAEYLDAHQGWFRRCAHPMQVDVIGPNSYALTIGNFGAFGYEIEPKVGLDLLPQQEDVYRIETVPVPGYSTMGYDIDFRGAMELVELAEAIAPTPRGKTTHIHWQLDLTVTIQFPKFIHALPDALIQKTGDRVLKQVVRQVSRRLTHKVQEDFHTSRGLALPKRSRKWS